MASKIAGSTASGIWIIGGYYDTGECYLTFPSAQSYPNIVFETRDFNENYLDQFDIEGTKVWLQVEPGHADIETLIDLVLARYGHHSCLIGFGIDVEWREPQTYPDGRRVTDEEALTWLNRVKAHNPNYKLFLKHWLTNKMPTAYPSNIVFICDSQGFTSLNALVTEFKAWGNHFSNAEVGYQIGYPNDRDWWGQLADPPKDIGTRLTNEITNCTAIYWVDYTILEVFPPTPPRHTLIVDSMPIKVPITFNNQPIGNTPQTFTAEEGTHTIKVAEEVESS